MTRKEILDAALKCVSGDRDEQYGRPENSFLTIAHLWNIYLNAADVNDGVSITVRTQDVAAMLALLKIARIAAGVQKDDNWIDLAGYAACGGEVEGVKRSEENKCAGCEFSTNEPMPADFIYGCTLKKCLKKLDET